MAEINPFFLVLHREAAEFLSLDDLAKSDFDLWKDFFSHITTISSQSRSQLLLSFLHLYFSFPFIPSRYVYVCVCVGV